MSAELGDVCTNVFLFLLNPQTLGVCFENRAAGLSTFCWLSEYERGKASCVYINSEH